MQRRLKGEPATIERDERRAELIEKRVSRLNLKSPRRKRIAAFVFVGLLISSAVLSFVNWDEEEPQAARGFAYIEFSEILRPDGDALKEWDYPSSGDHYDELDETTVGGDGATTYISTSTASEYDRFTMTDMTEEDRGEYTQIDSVTLWVIARKDASPFASLQIGLWNDSTYYLGIDVSSALTTSYVNYTWTWTTNPQTSAEWTIAQVNYFNAYVFTEDASPTVYVTQMGLVVPGRQVVWGPTFTSTPDTTARAGYDYSYTATTNETSIFSIYDYDGADAWATFTPANATLWGLPSSTYLDDSYDISIKATSVAGEQSAWQNFTLVVNDWAVSFTSTPIYTAAVDYEYNYSYTTNETCTYDVTFYIEGTGGGETAWLNPAIWQYQASEASDTIAYIATGNWPYPYYNIMAYDLSSLDVGTELEDIYVRVYGPTYDNVGTKTPTVAVNATEAIGGTSGGTARTLTQIKALFPAGSFAFYIDTYTGSSPPVQWHTDSGSCHATWQSQFDNNRTIYAGYTIWDSGGYDGSFGNNISTTQLKVSYIASGGGDTPDWLHWTDEGFIFGTPALANLTEEVNVSIEATTPGGTSTWQNFTITVSEGWEPTFTSSPIEVASATVGYEYTASCNETVTWPNDDSAWGFETNATWAHWGQANHTVWGTPESGDIGKWFYIHISANSTAGYKTGWQNYSVNVTELDSVPPDSDLKWDYRLESQSFSDPSEMSAYYYLNVSGEDSSDNQGITNWTWAYGIAGDFTINAYEDEYLDDIMLLTVGTWFVNLTVRDVGDNEDYTNITIDVVDNSWLPPIADFSTNWQCSEGTNRSALVDDPLPYYDDHDTDDENDTYIYYDQATAGTSQVLSVANLTISTESGYAYSVTVNVTALRVSGGSWRNFYIGVYDEETPYSYWSEKTLTFAYATYTVEYTTCPWTSTAWTSDDLNRTGIYMSWAGDAGQSVRVTKAHLWLTVIDTEDPVANAGPDQEVEEGETTYFDGSGSTDNAAVTNYTWTFDDGGTQTLYGATPTYVFLDNGTYVVTLNVSDAAGNWDEDTMTVTVVVPVPSFAEQVYGQMGDITLLFICLFGLVGMVLTPAWYVKYGRDDKSRSLVYAIFWFFFFFGLFYAGVYSFQ